MATLMAELQALRKEKGETEEAKKIADEQIEAMKKDHEEKVFYYLINHLSLLLSERWEMVSLTPAIAVTWYSNFKWVSRMNPGLHRFCFTSFRHGTRKLVPLSRPIRCKAKTKYNLVACVFPRFRQFVFFPSSSVVLNAQMAWVAEHFARVSPIPSHQSRCQNLTSLDIFTHVSSLEDVYIY